MPVRDYSAELRVEDNGDCTSTVTWWTEFELISDDKQMAETIRSFFRAGLDSIAARRRRAAV